MFFYADDMMRFAFCQELDDEFYEPGFAIVGVGFDSTTSYRAGSRYGPRAIREASYNFESYNMSFGRELVCNCYDIGDIQIVNGNYARTNMMIRDTVLSLLDMGLSPICMGGEHTVTQGVLGALKEYDEEYFGALTVVHFDAHLDMRDTYMDEKFSHATVLRRVHEMNPKEIVQIGVRSGELDEFEYVKSSDNIAYFTSRDVADNKEKVMDYLEAITGPIYITVDIDVLDPAFAPSVGTPAPCGITPFDLEDFIRILSVKEVFGLDVVEVSSDSIGDPTSINAAKVIYDFLSLQDEL